MADDTRMLLLMWPYNSPWRAANEQQRMLQPIMLTRQLMNCFKFMEPTVGCNSTPQ